MPLINGILIEPFADLRRANLQGANLQGANLTYATILDANLQGANLQRANLQEANLRGASLQGANLQEANFMYANLQGANLRGANIDYSCLPLWCGTKGIKVDRRIYTLILAHLCALDVDDEECKKHQSSSMNLATTSHRAEDLGIGGAKCHLINGMLIKPADLRGAKLQGANLMYANLLNANLQGANLQRANLQGANLRRADLQGANLQEANLQDTDLRRANLRGASIDFSCLPLWCGTKDMKVDRRIYTQILAHLCALDVNDEECKKNQSFNKNLATTSHRAKDLGIGETK